MNINRPMNSKGGKFVGAMKRLAQLRSKSRSTAPLQVGNVLTKKAPMAGEVNFDSSITGDKPTKKVASKHQLALNPNQK